MLLTARARGVAGALGALLLFTTVAAGQGTFGALPDPIGTRELLGLLERLDPSAAQIEAAERAHDSYKAAFARLRDREIADYLGGLRADGGERFPDRARLERLARAAEAVRRRIERLDETLFDEIGPGLTEDQLVSLPRVRLERARTRLLDERTRIPTEEIVDLAAVFHALDPAPPDRLAAGPLLAEYEVLLTQRLRALVRANRRLDLALLDRLDALGFVAADLDDTARRERVFAAMRAYWSEAERDMVGLAEDARRLGRSTCDRTAPLLSPAGRRRLRDAYYRAAYADLDAQFPALAELLRRIETDDVLSRTQRQDVRTLREAYEANADAILTRTANALDTFYAGHAPFDFDSPEEAALEELLEREAGVSMIGHEMTVLELREIVGPEGADRHELHDVEAVIEIAMGVRAPAPGAGQAVEEADAPAPDLLPPPLAGDDVDALAAALALGDDARAAVESIGAAHRDAYRAARDVLAGVMDDCLRAIERLEDDPGADVDAGALLDRVYTARRRFRETVAGLDARLVEQMVEQRAAPGAEPGAEPGVERGDTGAAPPAVDAWRRARERAVHAIGVDPELFPGTGAEALVDLLALLAAEAIERPALAAIERELVAFEEQVGAVVATRSALAEAYLETSDRWTFAPDPERPDLEEQLTWIESRLAAASREIVEVNRAMLARIVATLEPEAGAALERAYARVAHPDVYDDPTAVGPALARALARDDLTSDTVAALRDLASSHHPAYERLCRGLIEIDELAARGEIEESERYGRLARLLFERDELNARTERRLRTITDRPRAPSPR